MHAKPKKKGVVMPDIIGIAIIVLLCCALIVYVFFCDDGGGDGDDSNTLHLVLEEEAESDTYATLYSSMLEPATIKKLYDKYGDNHLGLGVTDFEYVGRWPLHNKIKRRERLLCLI